MALSNKIPRGIRNNNPLNIRIGNVWLGEVQKPTDKSFEQFISMEYGIRAGFIILRRYIRRYGKDTVAEIVSTWAPSSENNTEAYINTVCRLSNLTRDEKLRFEDKEKMVALVDAMIQVECGQRVPENKIKKGYEMA